MATPSDTEAREPADPTRRPRASARLHVLAWASVLVVAVLAVLVVRATVAVPVRISSASMEPTLCAGDVVVISQRPPAIEDLRFGDLVTFRDPTTGDRALKRVVGLPGESVVVLDGVLHVDGEPVEEPWVDHATVDGYYSRTFDVPAGTVFVLGDNRGDSIDSRDYGPVPADNLLGRVLLTVWPLDR